MNFKIFVQMGSLQSSLPLTRMRNGTAGEAGWATGTPARLYACVIGHSVSLLKIANQMKQLDN